MDVPEDDSIDRHSEGAVSLDDVERVGAKRRLCNLQDWRRAKTPTVISTVANEFNQLSNQDVHVDDFPLTESDSTDDGLVAAQSEAKKVHDQFALAEAW